MKHLFALIALAALVPHAAAQQQAARHSPTDPAAPVPQTRYDSAFAGYTSYREQDLAAWREVNDEVARIGGHIKMFGGAGPAGHGGAKPVPAKPGSGQPQAPQGGHKGN